jgi:hypothetical protein
VGDKAAGEGRRESSYANGSTGKENTTVLTCSAPGKYRNEELENTCGRGGTREEKGGNLQLVLEQRRAVPLLTRNVVD